MPYCQKCGAPFEPGNKYCPACGTVTGASGGAAPPPYAPTGSARGSRTPLIIAIVAVALVAVVALAALALWSGQDSPDEGGLSLSVVNMVDPAEGTLPADPGNRYVQMTVTLSNGADGDVVLEPSDFQLLGDDGSYYDYSEYATVDMPGLVTAGGSATLTVGFEVPENVQPVKIVFNGQYA